MSQYSTLDISMSDIKLFLLLAKERNFSRVALLANLTQPTLSRRISQMETALGMRLFDRDSRPIELTAEGNALLIGWKPLLTQFESAVQVAQASGRDRSNSLSIGTVDSANEVVSLPSIVRSVFMGRPNMDITMRYLSLSGWRSRMLLGEIDIFISALFEIYDLPPSCVFEQITVCSKDVVMLTSNPLAKKDAISFADLKDQRFVMNSPEESPAYSQYVNEMFETHGGYTPVVARYVPHANNLIASILHDDEVAVCDMFLRDISNPIRKRFPLPGVYSGLVAIWQRDNPNPNIRPFVETLRQHYKDAGHQLYDTKIHDTI